MNFEIPPAVIAGAALGVVGTLWNLWLTAERKAHEKELNGIAGAVDKLEEKIEAISTSYWSKDSQNDFDSKLSGRLDRIEDKLDRALAGGGQ